LAGEPRRARRLSDLVRIDDPDDPRIEPYRNVRDRDLAGRHRGFIAEGEVVLRLLVQNGRMRILSVLVAENRVDRLGDPLSRMGSETPIYVAAQAVMDQIVGFRIHRGVLALGERPAPLGADKLLGSCPDEALAVALFGVSNHDNVGGVFRNAAAFGASAVLLDADSCDPLYRKAIRVSVGASLIVPYARLAPGEDPISLFERHGFRVLALTPRCGGPLAHLAPSPRMAFLVGSEGRGLPNDLLSRAEAVRIPMDGDFDSLNLATATGIALHHLKHGQADQGAEAGAA
jgi:tRNA G18 (ribose-2'-O)-methylase SpoU